jgi:hypothetical protein
MSNMSRLFCGSMSESYAKLRDSARSWQILDLYTDGMQSRLQIPHAHRASAPSGTLPSAAMPTYPLIWSVRLIRQTFRA